MNIGRPRARDARKIMRGDRRVRSRPRLSNQAFIL
jgi:hypothetical protein